MEKTRGALSSAGILLGAWISLSAAQSTWAAHAATTDGYFVYVTNEGSGDLSVIDGATAKVLDTWQLGKRPRGIAASANGRRLFVAMSGSPAAGPGVDERSLPPPDKSADGIGVIDTATGRFVKVIRGVSDPEQVAIDHGGEFLYVASEDAGRGIVIRLRDSHIVARVPVGGEPEGVAVSPIGDQIAFTSEVAHRLSILNAQDFSVQHGVRVGARPRDAVFSPDGARIYVTGENDASLCAVDAKTGAVLQKVTVPGDGARPKGIVVNRTGDRLYLSTGRGGRVVAFDAASLKVLGSVAVGARPWGLALSPDERFIYTANGPSNDVSVIAAQNLKVVATISVGSSPWGLAVSTRN